MLRGSPASLVSKCSSKLELLLDLSLAKTPAPPWITRTGSCFSFPADEGFDFDAVAAMVVGSKLQVGNHHDIPTAHKCSKYSRQIIQIWLQLEWPVCRMQQALAANYRQNCLVRRQLFSTPCKAALEITLQTQKPGCAAAVVAWLRQRETALLTL